MVVDVECARYYFTQHSTSNQYWPFWTLFWPVSQKVCPTTTLFILPTLIINQHKQWWLLTIMWSRLKSVFAFVCANVLGTSLAASRPSVHSELWTSPCLYKAKADASDWTSPWGLYRWWCCCAGWRSSAVLLHLHQMWPAVMIAKQQLHDWHCIASTRTIVTDTSSCCGRSRATQRRRYRNFESVSVDGLWNRWRSF